GTAVISTPVSETRSVDIKTGSTANESPVTTTDKQARSDAGTNATGETTVLTGKVTVEDVVVTKATETQPLIIAPARESDEKKELARNEANKAAKSNRQELDKDGANDQAAQQSNRNVAASRKVTEPNFSRDQATNIFRGRVTDADNNGIPFANVTNVQDNNTGTYADAKGYFNLTYPDSVLNVQVRSVGFENNNAQLRNSVSTNQIILQDDRKDLSEVVINKQKINANDPSRSRDANVKLETPEPADGWDNYNTYVLNNLEVPEDLKNKPAGNSEVRVSFEVNKNGDPAGIKVEKSLCDKCDKEAIRLIKEGPKWKRKAKKGRATITIYF
ncbi:MAG: carboxypeptidase-like regulatory domain-containing protein, partial [Chitinophagaceae bacterium]